MTQFLPPNLLAFFAPREPIHYLPPTTKLPFEKKTRGYGGVGQFLHLFEDPKDTPLPIKIETKEERLERKKREKAEKAAYIKEQGIALWDPHNNSTSTSDPYKTLFIARINIDTSESKLRKEFESYGTIRKITMIFDKISGKQKGYAFIEYENEKDMHSAYKHGDGKKIDGRRVLVDVERGRTVKGWLPRRLGGGLSDSKPRIARDEREEKNFRDRFDRRDKERSRRSRSKERTDRTDRKRRSKSRERERDRGERDRSGRDRDRNRDRGDRHKDRYERGFDNEYPEQKVVAHNNFNDGDSSGFTATRRNRSRSRERKRYVRSRSRSGSRERKRSRAAYGKTENNGTSSEKERHGSQQFPSYDAGAESGEIEEGEDRSFDTEYRRPYGNNNNGQTFKTEDYDDEFQDTYNQPAYVAYNAKDD